MEIQTKIKERTKHFVSLRLSKLNLCCISHSQVWGKLQRVDSQDSVEVLCSKTLSIDHYDMNFSHLSWLHGLVFRPEQKYCGIPGNTRYAFLGLLRHYETLLHLS